jgi:hypothetical protein
MEKVFMNTQRIINTITGLSVIPVCAVGRIYQLSIVVGLCLLTFNSCKPDLYDDPIPEGFFPDIMINLSFPEYAGLNSDGSAINIDGGVRGIILYRKSSFVYIAYERNCSFHPNEACATVEVHSSNLFLIDTCCGSSFDLDEGSPTGGPAWRPLRKYRTFLSGSELTITSESLNGM